MFARLAQAEPSLTRASTSFLARAFELKAFADYEQAPSVSRVDAEEAIVEAAQFVDVITALVSTSNAKAGACISITSVAGLIGFPGSGYYAASKHAIEGWSDALRAEVAPLGIGVTCVEPGPFRTDWAGRSLRQTATRIGDYAETAGRRLRGTREIDGTQAGDPVRAGEAMIAVAESADPPRHLVLGAFGFEAVVDRMQSRLEEIRSHREVSLSADYPK